MRWCAVKFSFFFHIVGVIVVFCTVPLWAATTRLKLQGARLSTNQYAYLKHPTYNGLLRTYLDVLLLLYKFQLYFVCTL